jgi:hypothetical protein
MTPSPATSAMNYTFGAEQRARDQLLVHIHPDVDD